MFEDLAYGITPYSTYLHNDLLICNCKDRDFAYRIQQKQPDVLYNEIKGLLTSKLGLVSPLEILSIKNNIVKTHNTEYENWSSIKKKTIRETIIENFAIDMKNRFDLSHSQVRYLIDVIFLMLILKILTSDDIVIQNNSIVEIKGICFDHKKVVIERKLYDANDMYMVPEIIIVDSLMSDHWEKFLNTLRKLQPN